MPDQDEDGRLLAGFEAGAFANGEFTHAMHVRIACILAQRHPLPEAIERMAAGLRRMNALNAVPDHLPRRGYNHTITVAWMRIVASRLGGRAVSSEQFLGENPDLLGKGALARHYGEERLFSPEAKRGFVEPDREPLPDAGPSD